MKSTVLIVLIAAFGVSHGQSFLDMKDKKGRSLYEDNWFNLMIRYTHVTGKGNESFGGFTGNVSIRSAKAAKGEISVNYENVTLEDFIWKLANLKQSQKLN